jgi:hypothetical protein
MKKNTIWDRYATPILAIPIGLFILGFGGIRDNYWFGYVFGGLLIAWGIASFFNGDTKKW